VKREYKYTIVEKLKSEIDELFTCIYRACVREEKIDHITSAKEHLETIKIKIRTLHDLKQMPLNNMAKHSLSIESISKQLTAWQKALIKQQEKRELLPT
jgi:hypothetical protein